MRNYKMIIQYDGSRYAGWQRQPGKATIQGKLEGVLSIMCGREVEVTGAGRTDAGVHAMGMVANAVLGLRTEAEVQPGAERKTGQEAEPGAWRETEQEAGFGTERETGHGTGHKQEPATAMMTELTPENIRDYLNRYLPDDIAVTQVREASPRFHARYNALGKTYCYLCYDGDVKPVFDRKYCTCLEESPDLELMRQAAEVLKGTHDFRNFCVNPRMKKSTVRCVDQIDIEREDAYIRFTFHGNGFLQNMVRIMVGTLLEVGCGRMDLEQVREVLEKPDRQKAGPTAPARGLCLVSVDYG